MLEIPSSRPQPRKMDPADRLFRHRKRPDWGIGLWVAEERTRRRMRFEDGELRVFKQGFYHYFQPVNPERVEVDEVFEALAGEQERALTEQARASARTEKPPVMSFQEQAKVFRRLFGGGFDAPAFLDAHRRPAEGQGKKAHVDPCIRLAQDRLAQERLAARIGAGDFAQVHADACEVLRATSLVAPRRDVAPLETIDPARHEAFARTLFALLHGEARYRERFRGWCRLLRRDLGLEARWRMVTALPALVHPTKHVCVRRRITELQARTVQAGAVLSPRPSAVGYREARQVARRTQKALIEAGLAPRDFFDVSLFSWETLRPKGQALAAGLR